MEKSSLAQEEEAPSGFISSFLRIDWRYQVTTIAFDSIELDRSSMTYRLPNFDLENLNFDLKTKFLTNFDLKSKIFTISLRKKPKLWPFKPKFWQAKIKNVDKQIDSLKSKIFTISLRKKTDKFENEKPNIKILTIFDLEIPNNWFLKPKFWPFKPKFWSFDLKTETNIKKWTNFDFKTQFWTNFDQ